MFRLVIKAIALTGIWTLAVAAAPVNGELAPQFSGKTMTGEFISLEQYRGKPVVLEWTNHECPYVRKHYNSGNMQRTQRELTEDGATWISIVSSAPGKQGHVTADEAQKLTTERASYADVVVLDPDGDIGRLFAAKTTPHMFLIDESGVLVYQGAIDDKPSANPKSLEGAQNYILSAWEQFNEGTPIAAANTKPYGCSVKY